MAAAGKSKVKALLAPLRGMRDFLPRDEILQRWVMDTADSIVSRAGFVPVRAPVLERADLFAHALGEDADAVCKEMYLVDATSGFASAERHLAGSAPGAAGSSGGGEKEGASGPGHAMRPEGTAGVVRALLHSGVLSDGSVGTGRAARVAYRGAMFRRERPQRGRQREFTQFGIEHVGGAGGPVADAEAIALGLQCIEGLGVPSSGIEVRVNTLGDGDSRAAYERALSAHWRDRLAAGALGAASAARVARGAHLRVLDSKDPADADAIAAAPRLEDHLTADARARFVDLTAALGALGIPHIVDPRLVRGLDYYTSTVFELCEPAGGERPGPAVLAGGRYDSLVSSLGGPKTPAVGWAMGVDRAVLLATETHAVSSTAPSAGRGTLGGIVDPHVAVVIDHRASLAGDDARGTVARYALRVAAAVRGAGGTCVVEPGDGRALRKQLDDARRCGAAVVAIVGPEEATDKSVRVKDMSSGEQVSIQLDTFTSGIAEIAL